MTQYMLAVIHDWDGPPMGEENMQKAFEQVSAFNDDIQAKGLWVFGGGLEPPDIATVVNVTEGDTVMTDGPFAETKEHLGGFWVIEAPDLDAALALAARASAACMGPVEVRPFQAE